eukprot:SAG11_NODE_1295_length_5275_cov_3.069165_9_plen_79_part_00
MVLPYKILGGALLWSRLCFGPDLQDTAARRRRRRAGPVPYVDPPQLNTIRHARVPEKIYLYIRKVRYAVFHILPVVQY